MERGPNLLPAYHQIIRGDYCDVMIDATMELPIKKKTYILLTTKDRQNHLDYYLNRPNVCILVHPLDFNRYPNNVKKAWNFSRLIVYDRAVDECIAISKGFNLMIGRNFYFLFGPGGSHKVFIGGHEISEALGNLWLDWDIRNRFLLCVFCDPKKLNIQN